MTADNGDRVGLAWRDELAAQIYLNLGEIDHVELLAEREFAAPQRRLAAFRALGREVSLSLHGVALGLASSEPVDSARLGRMARLVERVEPDHWSEHLAFVRAGGVEIGHLAAAPFAPRTLHGTLRNLCDARRIVGSLPHLENVAVLLHPPGSVWPEEEFARRVLQGAGAPMLLDLHNLYANAWNAKRDPSEMLAAMPLDSVRSVHLSGGRIARAASGFSRLIDDHQHDPPAVVFSLLEQVACRIPYGLTVVIERDGSFPRFNVLLDQVRCARAALAAGRARAQVARGPRAA
jgi:uncharacterized protein (UPF0276 family)